MKRIALLALAAACATAACSSSKLPGGTGGTANGGTGGTASGGTGGTGGTASGGTGGTASCATAECIRPYECVRSCDGPIEYSGCCPCQAPLFDNYQQLACGARGGTAGAGGATGGAGGRGGTTGTAGTTGAGGRGGTTGAAGAGGRGGTSGAGGTGGGNAGTGGRACELLQCLRPYVCKRSCGGPVEYSGCCPCEPPLFDDYNGAVCGDGGQSSVTYVGCRYVGGYNRIVVAKRDTARNLCFNLALVESPTMQPPPGLTLPQPYAVQSAAVGPASACPTMGVLPTPASQVVGSVSIVTLGADTWGGADVDVTMSFGSNDAGAPPSEQLSARAVDLRKGCQ
jgi:hypothetical protein